MGPKTADLAHAVKTGDADTRFRVGQGPMAVKAREVLGTAGRSGARIPGRDGSPTAGFIHESHGLNRPPASSNP